MLQRLNLLEHYFGLATIEDEKTLLKEAEDSVRKAKLFKRDPFVSKAKVAIELLPDSQEKSALKNEITELIQLIKEDTMNSLVAKAEERLEIAEKNKSTSLLRLALNFIMSVPDSAEKLNLLERFNEISGIQSIEKLTKQQTLTVAERWVIEVETSPSPFAIKHAEEKINELSDEFVNKKTALKTRLDIAKDNFYEKLSKDYLLKAENYYSDFYVEKSKEFAEKITDETKRTTLLNEIQAVQDLNQKDGE